MDDKSLKEYERKRDFTRTAEPKPKKAPSDNERRTFVIQKHDASRLHYDFRLELDGALKSWAVPKGVPFTKGEKRLAVHVEDHPLDYASFEGVIPKGQYGGGTVMVWDQGTWEPLGGKPAKDLQEGKLHFRLHGQKIAGEWTLLKIRGDEENQWLLLKSDDSIKPITKQKDDESILTGRTMKQIATDRDAEWQSNREEKKITKLRRPSAPKKTAKQVAGPKLTFIEPMKAKFLDAPPTKGEWIYELKFDGFRAVALKSGSSVELLSRNNKDLGGKFPELVEACAELQAGSAILDGEIVALDPEGRSSFQLLQAYEMGEHPPLCYYVFDLLHLDGRDLQSLPITERKAQLQKVLESAPDMIRYSAEIDAPPEELLQAVAARGLEGIIGKRRGSLYEAGQRSGTWIKLKCVNEQEFVIGGYTPPAGTRLHFGALLVGTYAGNELRFAGKVGTGFNAKLLKSLHDQMQPLRRESCPFANLPEKSGGRWTQNITPAEMRRCTWVEPKLVCQLKFTEWTRDDKLRHPVFLGLRADKAARQVVREQS
jgi:bifunctional non-homologous end joining protein LigD